MNDQTQRLIADYYAAFNAGDMDAFLALLTDDVIHDINQGRRETGKAAFAVFMERMNAHYREQLVDMVIMSNPAGDRAAAASAVEGGYLSTDDGSPVGNGQRDRPPAGPFFTVRDGRIARVTHYYNLQDWSAQVGG